MSNRILIIGGGCSGTLLAVQLMRQSKLPLSVTVINEKFPLNRGIAYSTTDPSHLLNVRVARMSAFPDDPSHFENWIRTREDLNRYHTDDLPEVFMPRMIYGRYLEDLVFQETQKHPHITLIHIRDLAADIEKNNQHYTVKTESGRILEADKIILCTGNLVPSRMPVHKYEISKSIHLNPWSDSVLTDLDLNKDVMLIGTGLTMADTVISLINKKFTGTIYALSRHGKLPVEHPIKRPEHSSKNNFTPADTLENIYGQLKNRIRESLKDTSHHEPILEDIRPHSQNLWIKFSDSEKRRFIRHLSHHWGRLRHRLPVEINSFLQTLINKGQLKLLAGNIHSAEEIPEGVEINYRSRHNKQHIKLIVERLINCSGPEGDISRTDNILIRNLLSKGYIRPCPLKMGYDATPDGKVIGLTGSITENMFTIGPGLRGVLWESTAVPEIRVQAQQLSRLLTGE